MAAPEFVTDWNCVTPQNPYVEVLIPSVTVLRDRAYNGHKGGGPDKTGSVSLQEEPPGLSLSLPPYHSPFLFLTLSSTHVRTQ